MLRKRLFTIIFSVLFSTLLFSKTVKAGYYMDAGNFMSGMSENDPKAGFAYEYLQNIASYTGWTYEYLYGYFDELYAALLSGEIDILVDISMTEERKEIMNFSDYPMGAETYYLYGHVDDTSISADDFSSLEGKSLALGIDSYQYDLFYEWLKNHDIKLNITELPYDDVWESDFNEGIYDLFLSIDLVSEFGWEPIAKIGSSDIYIAVNKDRTDVLNELNEAQNQLYMSNPYYNNNLWAKYFSNSTISKRLSKRELAWFSNRNEINIGCLQNDAPFTYVDKKTGKVNGVIQNLLDIIKNSLNIRNIHANFKFFNTYDEILKALENKEIDVGFPCVEDVAIAEQHGLSLSRSLFSTSIGYAHLKNRSLKSSDMKVGVLDGSRSYQYYKTLPISSSYLIKPYNSIHEGLNAVLNEEVDSFLYEQNKFENFIYGLRRYEKLTFTRENHEEPICIAVNRENTELLSVINKAISLISDEEIRQYILSNSMRQRTYSFSDFLLDYLNLIIVSISIIIVLAVSLIISLTYVKHLINYDVLTNLLNRRTLKPHMDKAFKKAENHNEIFSVAIFDLDDFKTFNDTYGHECGDEILKTTAATIIKTLNREGTLFRWGGEEFLLLINKDREETTAICNQIRENIQNQVFVYEGSQIKVTITGGVATYTKDSNSISLFNQADNNLYIGKQNGKNQIRS